MAVALTAPRSSAREYDRVAPYYDAFTADYAYERWFSEIEKRAARLGLKGTRALDLACGTGKSTEPLLRRGYSVLGCDISAGMVSQAHRKFPELAAAFIVADMRELPELGQFDLVLCLDDAINYLLDEDELDRTFANVARVLAPAGLFAFDVNSLLTYRTAFAGTSVQETSGTFFVWRGEASAAIDRGEIATATVEIFVDHGARGWERTSMRHVQRHYPPEVVRRSLQRAGLECISVAGQHPGAELDVSADDEIHIKHVFFARHYRGGR
jgi:SAM-dependent methyltransferase